MDISSLIDSDASGSASKTPAPPSSSRKESTQLFKSPDSFKPPNSTHQAFRDHNPESLRLVNRNTGVDPPVVPPLRAPPNDEFRSPSASSYNSTQSPYQKTPSSALSTSQHPFSHPAIHSPPQSAHSSQQYQNEGQPFPVNTAAQGPTQTGSLPQTPTSGTPGGSYPPFHQQRPPSSHSASTPTSGHAQTPTFFRDSPQQSHAQIRGQLVSNPNQNYLSQPGTPLGPPTMLARQSSSLRRESPGSYEHKRTFSSGSHSQPQQVMQSPSNAVRSHSGLSPAAHGTIPTQYISHPSVPVNHQERERSLSVSPKTRLPSQPQLQIRAPAPDPGRTAYMQATPTKRKMGDSRVDEASFQQQASAKRSMSMGVGGMLNASQHDESSDQRIRPGMYLGKFANDSLQNGEPRPDQERSSISNQTISTQASLNASHDSEASNQRVRTHMRSAHESSPNEERWPNQERNSASTRTTSTQVSMPSTENHSLMEGPPSRHKAPSGPSRHPSHESQHLPRSSTSETMAVITSPFVSDYPDSHGGRSMTGLAGPGQSTSNPKREAPNRRVRYREIPIFAQSARQKGRGGMQFNGQRPLNGQSPSLTQHQVPSALSHPPVKQETNGENVSGIDTARSQLDPTNMLGDWEPTITNVIPAEELTREIMNYLFQSVVQMNGVAFGPAGGSAPGRGAVVEIEAKIGQIIDKNTNDRLRLPVMTECMLSRTDPNLRTAFRSSMTAAQHSRLNNFLNGALKASKPAPPGEAPKKARVPLDYVHTYETDAFYDLSQHALSTLPPSVQNYLDRRNKPKVRITTNQKTGQVTAKIIKVRISDIEIYSPQTPFDWRVSISLEVNYDGDLKELAEPTEGRGGTRPDRNKDRVSYKHSHYQIDLTQVKSAEGSSGVEKEHELEVEISSAAVREQGLLVLQRQPNKYEELIKGFVDNVRTLVRHCRE
ncbi:MAG: hypothetical protein LQ344_000315 [Seirophora lacunosa]|nr:MAG: hypothetical protein LQ344_000315 [Seirophora lacunosa]